MKFTTGQKILAFLASISTPEHAERIRKRNQEVLDKGKSKACCPHCIFPHSCKNCLWTYAIARITHRSFTSLKYCPCTLVPFVDEKSPNSYGQYIPKSIHLRSDYLALEEGHSDWEYARNWLQAHIDWTKNFNWGTNPSPTKYRKTIYD